MMSAFETFACVVVVPFIHTCADSHLSGHAAIWQGVLLACTSACARAAGAESSLPVPLPALPTWSSTSALGVRTVQLRAKCLVHLLVCLCDLSNKNSIAKVSVHPCLWEIQVPVDGATFLSA